MKAGVARRVLFLVDRRALAAQAVRAFKSFEPEPALKFDQITNSTAKPSNAKISTKKRASTNRPPRQVPAGPQPGHAFVYVCTIQRMAMNLFGRQAAAKPTANWNLATKTPTASTSPSTPSTSSSPTSAIAATPARNSPSGATPQPLRRHPHRLTATPPPTPPATSAPRLPLRIRTCRPRRLPSRLRRGQGLIRRAPKGHLPPGRRTGGRHRPRHRIRATRPP